MPSRWFAPEGGAGAVGPGAVGAARRSLWAGLSPAVGNPSCYIYATVVDESAFIGASPELLLAQRSGDWMNPLAGSARRGRGDDDAAVGNELLLSAKNRAEHAIVVDDLVARLGEMTTRLDHSELANAASDGDRATPVHRDRGNAASGVSTFDVLSSIHPTPAVGGTPRAEALAFIDKAEGIDRGWYSGGIGWVDPAGGAQMALALRCALINGDLAAVCGERDRG